MENNNTKSKIDIEYLKNLIGEDKSFAKDLFSIFMENVERNLEKMRNAILTNNINSWYMACHAFKGSAASVSASHLAKLLEYGQKHPEESSEQKFSLIEEVEKETQFVLDCINSIMD
jgi:HPt (histidine-containing phosphotransfer) domain-containing protein